MFITDRGQSLKADNWHTKGHVELARGNRCRHCAAFSITEQFEPLEAFANEEWNSASDLYADWMGSIPLNKPIETSPKSPLLEGYITLDYIKLIEEEDWEDFAGERQSLAIYLDGHKANPS